MPATTPRRPASVRTRRLVVAAAAVLVVAVALGVPAVRHGLSGGPSSSRSTSRRSRPAAGAPSVPTSTPPTVDPTSSSSTTEPPLVDPDPATGPTDGRSRTSAPPASAPPASAPPASAPPASAPPASAPPASAPPASPPVADPRDLTVDEQGDAALALVRYPWQRLPGYTIRFAPSTEAPAPDVGGMTTLTWGQAGGTTVVYVSPGEPTAELAGVAAFEIGHEVDAAAVEPRGGHEAIEDVLGVHPATWAPTCACDEHGYLSGWYAAAFAAAWSPGVGSWSTLAPLPSGAVLAAVARWLDPPLA